MKNTSQIRTIVIAGAGIMGVSLAQIFARCKLQVIIYDIASEAVEKGKELLFLNQKNAVGEKLLTKEESINLIDHILFSTDKTVFRKADFVIEAIVENLGIKQSFWKEVSELVAEDVVLTSNTSGLSISEIARSVKDPTRFSGMHWVNPPHIIPLVEVVKGAETSDETLKIVEELAISVRKKPVIIRKDLPGFIVNRLQYALLREALHIVENDVASIEDVDNVMKYGLGMRYACLGPFETADLGGLDTFYNVGSYLFKELSDQKEVPHLLQQLYEKGAYGTKTGAGFYDYKERLVEQVIEKRDKDFIKLAKLLYKDL